MKAMTLGQKTKGGKQIWFKPHCHSCITRPPNHSLHDKQVMDRCAMEQEWVWLLPSHLHCRELESGKQHCKKEIRNEWMQCCLTCYRWVEQCNRWKIHREQCAFSMQAVVCHCLPHSKNCCLCGFWQCFLTKAGSMFCILINGILKKRVDDEKCKYGRQEDKDLKHHLSSQHSLHHEPLMQTLQWKSICTDSACQWSWKWPKSLTLSEAHSTLFVHAKLLIRVSLNQRTTKDHCRKQLNKLSFLLLNFVFNWCNIRCFHTLPMDTLILFIMVMHRFSNQSSEVQQVGNLSWWLLILVFCDANTNFGFVCPKLVWCCHCTLQKNVW